MSSCDRGKSLQQRQSVHQNRKCFLVKWKMDFFCFKVVCLSPSDYHPFYSISLSNKSSNTFEYCFLSWLIQGYGHPVGIYASESSWTRIMGTSCDTFRWEVNIFFSLSDLNYYIGYHNVWMYVWQHQSHWYNTGILNINIYIVTGTLILINTNKSFKATCLYGMRTTMDVPLSTIGLRSLVGHIQVSSSLLEQQICAPLQSMKILLRRISRSRQDRK